MINSVHMLGYHNLNSGPIYAGPIFFQFATLYKGSMN